MVVGPQTGLHYKWFSVNGDFDPQEPYEPKSQFTFAPSSVRDRIWVEGAALGISEITVKAHRGRVMQKMGADSLAELVTMAMRLELPPASAMTSPIVSPVLATA